MSFASHKYHKWPNVVRNINKRKAEVMIANKEAKKFDFEEDEE